MNLLRKSYDFIPQEKLTRIIQELKAYNQIRNNLHIALYRYAVKKEYKSEGFGSFSKAYQHIRASVPINLDIKTIRKYHNIFHAYEQYGYSVEWLVTLPIFRLMKLKKYLKVMDKHKMMALLNLPNSEFLAAVKSLNEENV